MEHQLGALPSRTICGLFSETRCENWLGIQRWNVSVPESPERWILPDQWMYSSDKSLSDWPESQLFRTSMVNALEQHIVDWCPDSSCKRFCGPQQIQPTSIDYSCIFDALRNEIYPLYKRHSKFDKNDWLRVAPLLIIEESRWLNQSGTLSNMTGGKSNNNIQLRASGSPQHFA